MDVNQKDKDEIVLLYDLENSDSEYNKFISNNQVPHKNTYLTQPCIEYHFLLHNKHFNVAVKIYRSANEVMIELKEFMPNYKKGNKFNWHNCKIDKELI